MTLSRTARSLLIACAAALVAGCGGSSVAPSTGSATVPTAARRSSWISPDAKKKKKLLYLSDDGTDDVYVYSYPKDELVGTLTGFSFPEGECVDKKGDVFIANDDAQTILEYAHGGKIPLATLSDPGYYPIGCSVDPTTGNLVVTNTYNSSFTGGSVAIYAKASGSPTLITNTTLLYPRLCGFDPKGNLYVDGFNSSFAFVFAELPAGASSLSVITLNQSIGFPGNVQWDGAHIAVGDEDSNTIYQFTFSGSSGTEVGSTALSGARNVTQFWIHKGIVIGPDAENADVGIWNYPAGGSAVKTISGLDQPFGATISAR